MAKEFDIIVYGASGYTGRLVADYLAKRCAAGETIAWAMAGRNGAKLASVRDEIGAPEDTPLVVADAADPASVRSMVERTKVVLTTVGPYQLYGAPLVAACAEAGTDYVDLCGEVNWMHDMIKAHDAKARETGARIVFSCGFDSVPFDMGVFFLQASAKTTFGQTVPRVKGRVRSMQGTFSGGTAASGRATADAAQKDPNVLSILISPFSLAGGFQGPEQPTGMTVMEDPAVDAWVAPFVMAPINTKNIHRSNLLLGHPYGEDFIYDEMMITGPGEKGRKAAEFVASLDPMGGGEGGPKPGEGPTREEREAGSYDLLFIGECRDGQVIKVGVKGDMDPGYGSTSKIISECALCLIHDVPDRPGGILTPAPAFGLTIIDRLRNNAGLTFEVET